MPDGRKGESANQGEVEEFFVTGFEMFPDGGGIVGGERKKFLDLRPVEKVAGTNDFDSERDREVWSGMFRPLFMVLGREEVEGFRVKSALGGGFAEAGFTKENGLASGGNGGADGREFLESLNHER
jgi:hypothetical protein